MVEVKARLRVERFSKTRDPLFPPCLNRFRTQAANDIFDPGSICALEYRGRPSVHHHIRDRHDSSMFLIGPRSWPSLAVKTGKKKFPTSHGSSAKRVFIIHTNISSLTLLQFVSDWAIGSLPVEEANRYQLCAFTEPLSHFMKPLWF